MAPKRKTPAKTKAKQAKLEDVGVEHQEQAEHDVKDEGSSPKKSGARQAQQTEDTNKRQKTDNGHAKKEADQEAAGGSPKQPTSPKKQPSSPKNQGGSPRKSAGDEKEPSSPKKSTGSPRKAPSSPKKSAGATPQQHQAAAKEKAEKESGTAPGVVEEGRIYFFYRPRVGVEEAHNIDEVQRFYMILAPTSRPKAKPRLVVVGKKRLPHPEKHERFFGFVQSTADKVEDLTAGMGAQEYDTKTAGHRRTEPSRVAGEGVYSIIHQRDNRNSYLAYKLEVPEKPNTVQKELGIYEAASLLVSVKNPTKASPPNAGLSNKAEFTEEQKKEFGNYAWIPVSDPSLLDMERCELLLIGGRKDDKLEGELGDAAKRLEELAKEDVEKYLKDAEGDEHSALMEKLIKETGADKAGLDVKPADEGTFE